MEFTLLGTLGFVPGWHWQELVAALVCLLFLLFLFWYLTLRVWLDVANRIWRGKLKAERVRREAAEKANQAKTEFLANLSHEIRAPLNAIINFTELAPKTALNDELKEQLETVCTSAQWLIHIVNDVLEFSRGHAGTFRLENREFSVRDCISSAFQVIRTRAEARHLGLQSTVDVGIPDKISGDCTRLLQVIFNLVENAVQCTTDGGVVVRVELAGRSGRDISLRFSVEDTGIGIPDDQLRDFFKPLSHPSEPGSMTAAFGLGICENIVRLMGGSMEVQSRLGAGTIVRFTGQFQTLAERTPTTVAAVKETVCSAARPLTILLADQNAISRGLTKVLLESSGHLVREAAHGEELLSAFVPEAFDLVLMDLEIDSGGGLAVAQRLRALERSDAHTPIYALLNPAMAIDRDSCRAAGVHGFLSKPVEMDAVMNIVAAIALQAKPERKRPAPAVMPSERDEGRPGRPEFSFRTV